MDVFSKRKRSEIMSRVRDKGNAATELRFAEILRFGRITGWRRRYPLIGKPDFVFPAGKISIFVDGCFWHGCPIHGQRPKANRAFWIEKFRQNRQRDRFVSKALRASGWKVVRIWQHELKNRDFALQRIKKALNH